LHAVGKLVLACHYPSQYEEALAYARHQDVPLQDGERVVFGTSHAEVGAYLLWLWGLPDGVTEIVAYCGHPGSGGPLRLPTGVVHAAAALLEDRPDRFLNTACLTELGLLDRLPQWERLRDEVKSEAVAW
jgi:HD-like signal output (HDOD) protein